MSPYMYSTESFPNIPPFPDDVPTAPLVRLSLAQLRTDPKESESLFEASQQLGFFYLDLRGDDAGEELLAEADHVFEVGKQLFDLGRDELSNFDYKPQGSYMGYKGFGSGVVDANGALDRNEFYNAGKDDFLEQSEVPFAHPSVLMKNKPLISSYIHHAHDVITLLLTHLTRHLHLRPSTLTDLHRLTAISGDQVRFIKSPPQPVNDHQRSMGEHTDYGSLTVLFNRVGGLQVLPPGTKQWCYVRPLLGHCIINLGDAMVKFTNGLLRSNIHRVVAPPGEQSTQTRFSLVYFARPGDEVRLKRLESEVIPPLDEGTVEEDVSSKQWIHEKAMTRRTGVYAGPQTFRKERTTNQADHGAGAA